MTKVIVMTDGYMSEDTANVLMELADSSLDHTKLNGTVNLFEDEADAEAFRAAVIADSRLKGKLSGLSIGECK